MLNNNKWLTFLSAGILIYVLVLGQIWSSVARAAGIPEAYDVVTLPYQPELGNFNAFTAINNNGLAVGYGSRHSRSMGFVFDYRKQLVIAIIDDFLPMSINDSNKIAGIYGNQNINTTLATCTLSNGSCQVSLIEGAEFSLPFAPSAMTNSGFLAVKQWLNTPDEQFLLYRNGQLIYNTLVGQDANGVSQLHYDIQRNNTHLIAGAFKQSSGIETPFVKYINSDLSVTAQKLPAPGMDGGAGSGAAVAINSLNQIVISTINGTGEGQLYLCDYIGDVDNDGVGDCEHGLKFLGSNASANSPFARYPLNDEGLLVTPPVYAGDEIRLYDLTLEQPVAESLSSKGYKASLFASTQPLAVNNRQVILTSGAQTVLLVPQEQPAAIAVQIHSDTNPAVVAAEGGDRLFFSETIVNQSAKSQTLLYWQVLIMPDGTSFPRGTPKRLILDTGGMFTDNRARLRLPAYFPSGTYAYKVIVMLESNGERFAEELPIVKSPQ